MVKEIIGGIIIVIQIFICINVLGLVEWEKKNVLWKIGLITIINVGLGFIFRPLVMLSTVISFTIFLKSEKNEFFKSITSVLISIVVAVILEMSLYPIVSITTAGRISEVSIIICAGGVSTIIAYIICKIIRVKVLENKIDKFKWSIKDESNVINMANAILIILIFTVNAYFISNSTKDANIFIFTIVVSIVYSGVIVYLGIYSFKMMKKQVQDNMVKKQLEDLTEYNRSLEVTYNDMRKFRHDYINILSSMAGYIEDNDMEGLKKHFERNILPLGIDMGKNNSNIAVLHKIKIKEIKGVILTKILTAQEYGVEVIIDISEDIGSANIGVIDLCKCIGILIDNAIDAAASCDEGKIKIGFVKKGKILFIIVINSVLDDIAPIYKIYEEGFSTKGEGHGIGLSNLKEIVSRYPNVSLDTIIEEKEFQQILELS